MNYVCTVWGRAHEWFEHWLDDMTPADASTVDEMETVEFVGGPLDGYQHAVEAGQVYHLPPAVAVPARGARLNVRSSKLRTMTDPATSVAWYDLVPHGLSWRYEFYRQLPLSSESANSLPKLSATSLFGE